MSTQAQLNQARPVQSPQGPVPVITRQRASPPLPPPPQTQPSSMGALPAPIAAPFQPTGMPMTTIGVPMEIVEPWYSHSSPYSCFLPVWAGTIIWAVAVVLIILVFTRIERRGAPPVPPT